MKSEAALVDRSISLVHQELLRALDDAAASSGSYEHFRDLALTAANRVPEDFARDNEDLTAALDIIRHPDIDDASWIISKVRASFGEALESEVIATEVPSTSARVK
jgi:hypothetical protein